MGIKNKSTYDGDEYCSDMVGTWFQVVCHFSLNGQRIKNKENNYNMKEIYLIQKYSHINIKKNQTCLLYLKNNLTQNLVPLLSTIVPFLKNKKGNN